MAGWWSLSYMSCQLFADKLIYKGTSILCEEFSFSIENRLQLNRGSKQSRPWLLSPCRLSALSQFADLNVKRTWTWRLKRVFLQCCRAPPLWRPAPSGAPSRPSSHGRCVSPLSPSHRAPPRPRPSSCRASPPWTRPDQVRGRGEGGVHLPCAHVIFILFYFRRLLLMCVCSGAELMLTVLLNIEYRLISTVHLWWDGASFWPQIEKSSLKPGHEMFFDTIQWDILYCPIEKFV